MNLFKLAWRNLVRKRKRLIVTVGAMGVAGALIIFYNSLIAGMTDSMLKNMIDNGLGHVQVHAQGYREEPDLYTTVSNSEAILKAADEAGYTAAPRLYADALAASGDFSAGSRIWGVDLQREGKVTRLPQLLSTGRWLDAGDPDGAVLGRKLARKLNVKTGDEVVVLGQAADGSVANELFIVRGILGGASAMVDDTGLLVSQSTFQRLFVVDATAHEIVIRGPGLNPDLDAIKATIAEAAGEQEVLSWLELNKVVAAMIDQMDVGMFIMMAIAYLAVGMVVFNAMLMSVFERIREFGILKALGVRPWQVFTVISLEALAEAALAALCALGVGLPPAFYFARHGLDLSALMKESVSYMGMNFEPVWYASVQTDTWATPVVSLFALTLLAVLYPAAKAALISPIRAIYHR